MNLETDFFFFLFLYNNNNKKNKNKKFSNWQTETKYFNPFFLVTLNLHEFKPGYKKDYTGYPS